MLTKRYVKKAYILEAYCDKCGSKMESAGVVYNTYPEQYPYKCTNKKCDGFITFQGNECPGKLLYEFEEVESPNLLDSVIMRAKNQTNVNPVRLERKLTVPDKLCPYCNTILKYDIMKIPVNRIQIMYECPNYCKLTFEESNEFIEDSNISDIISYEEESECITSSL